MRTVSTGYGEYLPFPWRETRGTSISVKLGESRRSWSAETKRYAPVGAYCRGECSRSSSMSDEEDAFE